MTRDTWEEERKKLKRLKELEKAFDTLLKEDEKAKELLSKEIEKNRALEIIKKKQVSVDLFFYCANRAMYNNRVNSERQLTQEEYDLLKEALL